MASSVEEIMKTIEIPNEENRILNDCVVQFDEEQKTNEETVESVFSLYDNSSKSNILIKVIILNNRYSVGLNDNPLSKDKIKEYDEKEKKYPVDVMTMAKHIYNNRKEFNNVKTTDEVIGLVETIRNISGFQDAYSFATKYCSWSFRTLDVPIVDSYVKGLLYRLNKKYGFTKTFTQADLNDYRTYKEIYVAFVKACGLQSKKYKDIDKYLWQYAKNMLTEKGLDIRIFN